MLVQSNCIDSLLLWITFYIYLFNYDAENSVLFP